MPPGRSTHPRLLEDALRASEASYRAIFDSSNDAIFVHDLATGAVLDANRMACQMSGVSRAGLMTRGMDIIGSGPPPFTAELALEYIRRAAAGEPQRFEWCSTHPMTGEALWVEVGLQRLAIGGEDRLLALVRDIRERKQAEQALRASEESYRTIFHTAGVALWLHDLDTMEILEVNQTGCELYGYTHAEMMGLGRDALLYPGSEYTAERVGGYIGRAIAGETPRFEWMGRHKDGGEVWGEVTLRRVTVGGSDRILATVRDIKERKRSEQALREANEVLEQRVAERTAELAEANRALEEEIAEHEVAREELLQRTAELEGLFRALPDMYFRTDADGTVRDFRTADLSRLPIPPEAFLGQRLQSVMPAEVAEQTDVALRRLAETGELVHFEYVIPIAGGPRDYEARFVRLGADQAIIVVRDITERKNAERALRQSEEHFRRLIENSSDYVMILDATGAITYIGPSVERILGHTPEEMMGLRPADLVHAQDVPLVMDAVHHLVDHPGAMTVIEFRTRHRDGSWRVIENVGRTLSPHSADEGLVANCRDITERRRAEQALREATQAAERANQAKSEFLSRMSHELRTPMNSILGFAQVLEGTGLPERQARCVQHILRAGQHLLQLINEVLEISRIEAGRHHLSLEPVRLGSVLQEAVGLARPIAAQARVGLEYAAFAHDRVYVRADRQRLSQVLLNLLSNAIKYNRAGGRVRLSCASAPDADDGAPRLRVRVEDTGHGISPEKQDELFTPFARLGAENSEVEGTGLGLALSQRLAEAMGGSLALERTGAEGSVFSLELQMTPNPLEHVGEDGAVPRSREALPHPPATLLYIEDNLANLSLVETILWERPNWRTIPALQGQIGVELAREHLPDLILLDLHLPDVRGEEVLRRLREHERTASIPVVVISADATHSATERLLQAGAAAFLTKPLNVVEFLTTLNRLLPQRDTVHEAPLAD